MPVRIENRGHLLLIQSDHRVETLSERLGPLGWLGSTLATIGALLLSWAKCHCHSQQPSQGRRGDDRRAEREASVESQGVDAGKGEDVPESERSPAEMRSRFVC